jgi:4-hydroxy-tetrahydrodipicolinate synthase
MRTSVSDRLTIGWPFRIVVASMRSVDAGTSKLRAARRVALTTTGSSVGTSTLVCGPGLVCALAIDKNDNAAAASQLRGPILGSGVLDCRSAIFVFWSSENAPVLLRRFEQRLIYTPSRALRSVSNVTHIRKPHSMSDHHGKGSTPDCLSGVFPVLATPFLRDGAPDTAGLRSIARYVIDAGADGVVFPGVASEYDTLIADERFALAELVASEARGNAAFVVGGSAADPETTLRVAQRAKDQGAAAIMVMAPKTITEPAAASEFFRRVAASANGVPIMLQNAPPPAGSGLPVSVVLDIARAVPQIHYIKEEALPAGARITQMLAGAPPTLRGVFGGAGGRYITDELARGAVGTMPACELAELHVALVAAHRRGDRAQVRHCFNRMLPLLNFQAVFRMAMTKETLRRRGIIDAAVKRAAGPELDAGDQRELTEMLDEVADLLAPPVIPGR